MAKRKASSPVKKNAPGFAFSPTYTESRVKKREVTATTLRDQGGGLLQLRLGRAAQGQGLGAAFGLAFNAFLIYVASTSGTILVFSSAYLDALLWLMPLVVGAAIGADALSRKWTAYKGYRGSRHFILSAAAFALSFLGIVVIFLEISGILPNTIAWLMYPLSVSTIAIGLISMADTWRGSGVRKIVSVASALFLPLLMVAWVGFSVDPKDLTGGGLLAMFLYFIMALAALISGSELHIIASSTSAAEREILTASDTKLSQLHTSLRELQKALEFRQKGLDEKEVIMEADRKELDEEVVKADTQSGELAALQAQLEKKEKELRDFDKRIAGLKAEIDARVEQMKLKESDLTNLDGEIEKGRKELASREAALTERDKELKRVAIEVTAAQRQLDQKAKEASSLEEKLTSEDRALEARQKAILQKEKTLQLKESELRLRSEQVDATKATKEQVRVSEMKDWEQKILAKEKELGTLEVELKTLEDQLKERYENATNIEKRAGDDRKHIEAKEKELLAREKMISDKEAGLEKTTTETERLRSAVKQASARLKQKEEEYGELFKSTRMQQASATSNEDAVTARQMALDARQKKLDDMQAGLKKEIDDLSARNRELLQMKKETERKEQTLTVKALELEEQVRAAREARAAATTPGIKDMDKEAALARWQDDLEKKSEEIQRRQYQMQKEMEAKEQALRAQVQAGVTEGMEEVVIEEKKERVKSGTPRLDDLLYGGIPFNSNLMFVGPPFAGKEVVILNFVAEGLKKGIPAILVTTSKPPADITKEMAPILPTFVEYEQLGLVNWIDASGSTGSQGKPVRDKHLWRVNGPADFESLLKIVDDLDAEFKGKHPYFRVAFLSLSSCISVPDQNAALNFVQRLVNRLRQTKAVAAFALERGMHTDQQVESLEHLMDGAIHFKSEKQKTQLQVIGLGEVQTRDWVPYKASNKAITIGSFQLERIR